jgi:hypothetical protein
MRSVSHYIRLLQPWSGFVGGGLGWLAAHQLGGDNAFNSCETMSPLIQLLIGLAGASLAIGGGLWSRPLWSGDEARSGRHFVALVGTLAAAVFLLAIILQTSAALIIPQCHA